MSGARGQFMRTVPHRAQVEGEQMNSLPAHGHLKNAVQLAKGRVGGHLARRQIMGLGPFSQILNCMVESASSLPAFGVPAPVKRPSAIRLFHRAFDTRWQAGSHLPHTSSWSPGIEGLTARNHRAAVSPAIPPWPIGD